MSEDNFNRKLKHLEFIQNVITRMNTNSFMIKGWAVTLVAALFALSEKTTEHHLYLISLIPVAVFWILDGFFIATERRFRNLYNDVSNKIENDINFKMDPYFDVPLIVVSGRPLNRTEEIKNWTTLKWNVIKSWFWGCFSITLIPFYGVMLIVMFIVKTWLDV